MEAARCQWRHPIQRPAATTRHAEKDILQRPANAKRGPVTLLPVGLLHQRSPQPLHRPPRRSPLPAPLMLLRKSARMPSAKFRAKEAQDK